MIICNTAVMIEDMKWNKKTADKRISNMRKIASELKIRIMQNETFFGENCDIKELAELVEKKMGTESNLSRIIKITGTFVLSVILQIVSERIPLTSLPWEIIRIFTTVSFTILGLYVVIYGIYGMFCKKEQLGRLNEYLGLQDLGTPLWKALQRPSQLQPCIVKILDSAAGMCYPVTVSRSFTLHGKQVEKWLKY